MLNEHIYKQPIVIFLGAGASAPLGKMTTLQFMQSVITQGGSDINLISEIMSSVEPSEELGKKVDIEAVLDYLEKIIEASVAYEKLKLLDKPDSLGKLDGIIKLREQIQDLVVTHYSEIDADKAFKHYAPLYEEGFTIGRLPIFTNNYDLAIEKFYEHPQAPFRLIDGFKKERLTIPRWSDEVYENYVPVSSGKGSDIILFKLHGSVDWVRTPGGHIQRTEAKQRDPGSLKTVLAYPTRTKREIHEEPFRTNYDYLLACLAHTQICFVVGFSFRDQEIVEHFREAAGLNKNLRVIIFDTNEKAVEGISGKFKLDRPLELIKIPSEAAEKNIRFVAKHVKEEVSKLIDSH